MKDGRPMELNRSFHFLAPLQLNAHFEMPVTKMSTAQRRGTHNSLKP